MLHIVFNEPDLEVISKAMEMDDSLGGQIMIIRDDYAVGPLGITDDQNNAEMRKD